MSFKASDQRVYVTNVRIPVFDQNSEESRVILQDVHDVSNHAIRVGVTGPIGITGPITISGPVSLTGPVGITGPVEVSGTSFTTVLGSSYLNTYSKIVGTSNGTDNKVILTDAGGRVQTNARMSDGAGNTIGSTGGSLNVNVTNPIGITGLVGVTGTFSTTIAPGTLVGITGPVDISGQTVLVGNFPATQSVTGTVGVTGSVSVSNFPATQSVTGTVNVGNFPATQGVTGTVGVTGSVSVSNFPATQGVTGTVNVGNFPASQGVTGTVGVRGLDPLNPTPTTYEAGVHTNKGLGANIYGYGSGGVWYPVNSTSGGASSIGTAEALCTIGRIVNTTAAPVNTRDASLNAILADASFTSNRLRVFDASLNALLAAPITVSGATFDATRLTVYDSSLNNKFADLTYTGSLLNVYDSNVETKLTATNLMLTTIENDISGGVISKGLDDTGTPYAMYTDANGTQRVEVIPGHQETAKYIFETDVSVIASSSGAGWSIDVRDRPGWYYNAIPVSTLKWYGNNGISTPPALEHNKMQAIYMIATLDVTSLLPKMQVITSASVWEYTLPAASNIINGETYLFYYGNKAINLHPSYHPLQMTLTLVSGPGLGTEVISEINILTATSGTNGSQFLLQDAGIWNQTLLQRFEVAFENTRRYRAESNLLGLNFTGTKLQTIDASLNSVVTALSAKQVVTPTGSRGNIINNTGINGWADTTASSFATGNNYGTDCVFTYQDNNTLSDADIAILGSLNNSTWDLIGIITPIIRYTNVGGTTGRWGTTRINPSAFNYIAIRNVSSTNLVGCIASLYAGKPAGVI